MTRLVPLGTREKQIGDVVLGILSKAGPKGLNSNQLYKMTLLACAIRNPDTVSDTEYRQAVFNLAEKDHKITCSRAEDKWQLTPGEGR